MEEIEKQLIAETIIEGAIHPSNKAFSTKTISRKCGVSEFTLYSRFATKEDLIVAALMDVTKRLGEKVSELETTAADFEDFSSQLLDYCLASPSDMRYLANYGIWIAKNEEDATRMKRSAESSIIGAAHCRRFLNLATPEEQMLVWSSFIRQLIYAAQMILDDESGHKPPKAMLLKILLGGIHAFSPVEEKKGEQ
jgi:AcrR family transcriptional regulator